MTGIDMVPVERVSPSEVRPLRLAVLRPGQPADRVAYPGDDLATTVHVGVRDGSGALVAVASLYREPVPEQARDRTGNRARGTAVGAAERMGVRVRGMATLPRWRGRGYGRALVDRGLVEACAGRSAVAWCNARTTAAGYYERLGFAAASDVFDLPDIGPHLVMTRSFVG